VENLAVEIAFLRRAGALPEPDLPKTERRDATYSLPSHGHGNSTVSIRPARPCGKAAEIAPAFVDTGVTLRGMAG
jgi:hypothetical protein